MSRELALSIDQIKLIKQVEACAPKRAYLVGGVVRDLFLQQSIAGRDLDFIIEGDAFSTAQLCAQSIGGKVKQFPQFLTAKIVEIESLGEIKEVDFATARTESYLSPGDLPQVTAAGIRDDLKRRDFTINAIAMPLAALLDGLDALSSSQDKVAFDIEAILSPKALDFFSGLEDLKRREVRVLHKLSFIDDPTRIFRACRYATRIDGVIEAETQSLIKEAVATKALNTLSHFRKLNELKKILAETNWQAALALLASYGVLSEMGLFEGDSLTPSLAELQKRAKANASINADGLFDMLLALSYGSLAEELAEERFRQMGFGKKTLRRLKDIIAGS